MTSHRLLSSAYVRCNLGSGSSLTTLWSVVIIPPNLSTTKTLSARSSGFLLHGALATFFGPHASQSGSSNCRSANSLHSAGILQPLALLPTLSALSIITSYGSAKRQGPIVVSLPVPSPTPGPSPYFFVSFYLSTRQHQLVLRLCRNTVGFFHGGHLVGASSSIALSFTSSIQTSSPVPCGNILHLALPFWF